MSQCCVEILSRLMRRSFSLLSSRLPVIKDTVYTSMPSYIVVILNCVLRICDRRLTNCIISVFFFSSFSLEMRQQPHATPAFYWLCF